MNNQEAKFEQWRLEFEKKLYDEDNTCEYISISKSNLDKLIYYDEKRILDLFDKIVKLKRETLINKLKIQKYELLTLALSSKVKK